MASNVNSKNKDMNNTSISDSSEDDDIFRIHLIRGIVKVVT